MTAADDIKAILKGKASPADIRRVCQIYADLEEQLRVERERRQATGTYAAALEAQRAVLLEHVHAATEHLLAAVEGELP